MMLDYLPSKLTILDLSDTLYIFDSAGLIALSKELDALLAMKDLRYFNISCFRKGLECIFFSAASESRFCAALTSKFPHIESVLFLTLPDACLD